MTRNPSASLAALLLTSYSVFGNALWASDPKVYYVPTFDIRAVSDSPDGEYSIGTHWRTSIAMLNATSEVGWYRPVARYGFSGDCTPQPLLPLYATPVPECVFTPTAIGFVGIEASMGVVVSAHIERVVDRYPCPDAGAGSFALVSRGRAPAPVYSSLFPSGSTVICGDVDLGSVNTPVGCADPAERARARINVTLLNAGSVAATFRITVYPGAAQGQPIAEHSLVVPAHSVVQENDLPIPSNVLSISQASARVWIAVSSTEPFLAYASGVLTDSVANANYFQVYPAQLVGE